MAKYARKKRLVLNSSLQQYGQTPAHGGSEYQDALYFCWIGRTVLTSSFTFISRTNGTNTTFEFVASYGAGCHGILINTTSGGYWVSGGDNQYWAPNKVEKGPQPRLEVQKRSVRPDQRIRADTASGLGSIPPGCLKLGGILRK